MIINALSGTAKNNRYKKERKSNIELLRIIAMFLVLVLHSGFISVKSPTIEEVRLDIFQPLTRYLFQSFSISCVDIFVLISGWFGIRPTVRGLFSYLFQCFYFIFGVYVTMVLIGHISFSLTGFASCFLFVHDYDYWFVRTYLLLFIISPILNIFVQNADRKTFRMVLIGFFAFQTIYAWGYVAVNAFAGGYSTISFIGLYLLARYVHVYKPSWSQLSLRYDILIIVICIFVMAFISLFSAYIGYPLAGKFCDSYICPMAIILSLFMVIVFSKLQIQSSIINFIAVSCFSVYLFHTHITIFYKYFKPTILNIYTSHDGILTILLIGLFLLAVFFVSIILDLPRRFLWKRITNIIFK